MKFGSMRPSSGSICGAVRVEDANEPHIDARRCAHKSCSTPRRSAWPRRSSCVVQARTPFAPIVFALRVLQWIAINFRGSKRTNTRPPFRWARSRTCFRPTELTIAVSSGQRDVAARRGEDSDWPGWPGGSTARRPARLIVAACENVAPR